MKIKTFAQRQYLQDIYKKFFDPYSTNYIDDNFLFKLHFYDIISDKEYSKLLKKFQNIDDNLFKELKEFDRKQYKNYE